MSYKISVRILNVSEGRTQVGHFNTVIVLNNNEAECSAGGKIMVILPILSSTKYTYMNTYTTTYIQKYKHKYKLVPKYTNTHT